MRLEWLDQPLVRTEIPVASASLASPGADHIEELLELGRIGYVRGIEAKLAQLALDPATQPFVDEIRRHLRNFDFERYTAVLEAMDAHD